MQPPKILTEPQRKSLSARWPIGVLVVVVLALVGALGPWSPQAMAQSRRPTVKDSAETKRENLTLETKDGVILACTYYPGVESKETVPVILIHGWGGNRGEMHPLATHLQRLKHSVITFDLRGHGQSVEMRGMVGAGEGVKIELDKLRKPQIVSMSLDVEAVKKFLIEQNNEEKLNIEMLCVVGSEFGAVLAMNWAVLDWNARSLPAYKMGQDVKALVLISPKSSFRGLTTRTALAHPIVRRDLSVFIAVGSQQSRDMSDAKRIYNSFERFHTNEREQDLVLIAADTSLQGAKLLDAEGVDLPQKIGFFIEQRLVNKAEFLPWRDRSSPFEN
jgi:pimeloyl-ACP methyl ester carboxylesterase